MGHASKFVFYQNGWLMQEEVFFSASFINALFSPIFKFRHSPRISLSHLTFILNSLSSLACIHAHGFTYYIYVNNFKCIYIAPISHWSSRNAYINIEPNIFIEFQRYLQLSKLKKIHDISISKLTCVLCSLSQVIASSSIHLGRPGTWESFLPYHARILALLIFAVLPKCSLRPNSSLHLQCHHVSPHYNYFSPGFLQQPSSRLSCLHSWLLLIHCPHESQSGQFKYKSAYVISLSPPPNTRHTHAHTHL